MWILWIILIVVVIYMLKDLGGNNRSNNSEAGRDNRESALDILRRRYASGEIDEVEFERRKKELEKE